MASWTKLARSLFVVIVAALSLGVLVACGGSVASTGDGGGDASTDSRSKTDGGADARVDAHNKTDGHVTALTAVQVTPSTASIHVGQTQKFAATGIFSDGTKQDLTATVTWASSDATVATIDAAGLATAVAMGTTTIRATRGGITGKATLNVVGGPPKSLVVTPATATVCDFAPVPFTATAITTGGITTDVTSMASWTSSIPSVATVGAATGIATPARPGMVTITATFMGLVGKASLTVASCLIKSIAVTPPTPTLAVGLTQQFTATATNTDGSTQDVTSIVSWTSSSTPTATISGTGLATAVAAGTSTITATATLGTVGGIPVSGTAKLTVVTGLPPSLTVTPSLATAATGGAAVPFKATVLKTDGTSADVTTSAAWTSSAPSVATVGAATGLATPLSAGTVTITATYMGISGTASLVVASGPPLTGIIVTPASPSIASGTTQPFTATATFTDGSERDVTSAASWTSSSSAIATISAAGVATGVAPGATTVTATLTISGVTKSGTATLTVTPASLVSITIAPASFQGVCLDSSLGFVATGYFSDGTTQDISDIVTWTGTPGPPPGGAVVFAGGVAHGAAPGNVSITATLGAVTSNATPLVIQSCILLSIVVSPNPPSTLHVGQTEQFTATGISSSGTTMDLTALATWSSSGPVDASITTGGATPGLALGLAGGTAMITATLGTVVSPAVPLTVDASLLTSMAVTPPTESLALGETRQLTATATYADGTTGDISSSVSWVSAAPADFTVSGSGLVTGVASTGGSFKNVTATQGAVSATATVNVTSATVSSVAVTCTSPNVLDPSNLACIPGASGFEVACTALATYSDGSTGDVTPTASWHSDTAGVATPAGLSALAAQPYELFSVNGSGTANVTAQQGGVKSPAIALVGVAESLDTTPTSSICTGGGTLELYYVSGGVNVCSSGTLSVGSSIQLRAAAAYKGSGACAADAFFDVTDQATWNVTAPTVARVDPQGLVHALTTGTATINAAYTPPATATGATATFSLTVGP